MYTNLDVKLKVEDFCTWLFFFYIFFILEKIYKHVVSYIFIYLEEKYIYSDKYIKLFSLLLFKFIFIKIKYFFNKYFKYLVKNIYSLILLINKINNKYFNYKYFNHNLWLIFFNIFSKTLLWPKFNNFYIEFYDITFYFSKPKYRENLSQNDVLMQWFSMVPYYLFKWLNLKTWINQVYTKVYPYIILFNDFLKDLKILVNYFFFIKRNSYINYNYLKSFYTPFVLEDFINEDNLIKYYYYIYNNIFINMFFFYIYNLNIYIIQYMYINTKYIFFKMNSIIILVCNFFFKINLKILNEIFFIFVFFFENIRKFIKFVIRTFNKLVILLSIFFLDLKFLNIFIFINKIFDRIIFFIKINIILFSSKKKIFYWLYSINYNYLLNIINNYKYIYILRDNINFIYNCLIFIYNCLKYIIYKFYWLIRFILLTFLEIFFPLFTRKLLKGLYFWKFKRFYKLLNSFLPDTSFFFKEIEKLINFWW